MSGTAVLARGTQDHPPLPQMQPEGSRRRAGGKLLFADGCYFICYGSDVEVAFVGTMRVSSLGGQLSASGDLYAFNAGPAASQSIGQMLPTEPGTPIFPIADYSYYLRVVKIEPTEPGFSLTFEAYRYFPSEVRRLDGGMPARWAFEATFTARMMPAAAPPGYPQPDQFFVGEVLLVDPNAPPLVMQLQMGWVSELLRRAVVEIDRVPDSYTPLNNGGDVTWQSVFRSFGWDMKAIDSDHNLAKSGTNPVWNATDAEAAMRQHRDSNDLDREWRFYVLIVPQIFAIGDADGFMYHHNREALYVAGHFIFPDEPQYGALRGKRLDGTGEFFRTIVHEMGHAMGLGHNDSGFHFMRPTPSIAQDAPPNSPFPNNIDWSFDPGDENKLRHWPDIVVRPGGATVGAGHELELVEAGQQPQA